MENNTLHKLGIDIGSTTVKVAVLDEHDNLLFSDYERHFANIRETLSALIQKAFDQLGDRKVAPMITGSGGLTLAKHLDVPFVQEVISVSTALQHYAPQTDVAIELGGEDAKIIYFEGGNVEQRMNGICAGGTGSFIDQMASLIQTDASGLNEYAKNYKAIYPIAARCGVFAKTDIQPLINEGATREDLSASIFQAVVNQTISGLACGKPIRGHVAFLGGPLHFLSELKAAFIRTLNLDDEHAITPDNSHLYAAIGSALNCKPEQNTTLSSMLGKLNSDIHMEFEVARLDPLFKDQAEYDTFRARHDGHNVKTGDLSTYEGNCYLGIDAGSTTTKIALVGEDGSLLYSFYSNNNGSPLSTAIRSIKEIYEKLPANAHIVHSCSTGYGEALLKAALMLDDGEVETVAHYYAAAFFDPEVDCILDIGGQDMKCIKIKNQTVDSVQLNEACSSGCGSFIETFAKSLNYSVQDFAKEALFAKNPIDLGTRCTVFMNSKVKQAQKEGASVADISAGLAYSVIKNALFKVIKLSDASELGKNIVVQGGTFYNDAVLRSFEKISGCECVRPDIAGIMGAFGAALIAREHHEEGYQTTMLSIDEINALTFDTKLARCQGCTNHCLLTINRFSGNRQYITGNRCERGVGGVKNKENIPNLFEYKNKRLFDYPSLKPEEAPRGTVGIPRVLNMYENFPFWATFFKKLGFSVVLSPQSTRKIYELGIDSIPSESECYPAKLAHGHVTWLIHQNVDFIFYPCVPYERNEFPDSNNHYNCPIVTSYAENIKNNVEDITSGKVRFYNPFMAFTSEETLSSQLVKTFGAPEFAIPESEIRDAVSEGYKELAVVRMEMQKKGEEVLDYMEKTGKRGIVLAGRPYHVDPEINHGIPELINSYGIAVLTEDSVSHLHQVERRRMPQARGHKARYREEAFYELEKVAKQRFNDGNVKLDMKASYIGSKIFEADHLYKRFGDLKILEDFSYIFARYEKMGIVGNNGTGKSTFIKILMGEQKPDSGTLDIGETVRFGYYSQDGLKFDEQMKVIDVVQDIAEVIELGNGKKLTASQFLQHFLFTPETQHSYVYKLSGGERRRLYLCTVLMRNPNFLVLDEPTNDLDIITLQVLEEYLQNFKGCVIVVSHDRYFMDKVVDHLLVFKGQGDIRDFPGNYSDYRDWREAKEQREKEAEKPKEEKTARVRLNDKRKMSFKEKKEFEQLEQEIAGLEQEKADIEAALCSGTLGVEELTEKSKRLPELNDLIDEKTMRWLELSEIEG